MSDSTLQWAMQSLKAAILQPLALGAISSLMCSWKKKSQLERTIDSAICLVFLIWNRTEAPLLSICFAIAYAMWTFLPGSLSSLDLPSHRRFMRNLQIVQPSDEQGGGEKECKVCWDDEQELAKLACNHYCCRRCLQLMGEKLQNTCPVCRRPLFSGNDLGLFLVCRANMTCYTVNTALLLFKIYLEIRDSSYWSASISLAGFAFQAGYAAWLGYTIWLFGENWWCYGRAPATLPAWSFRTSCFALVSALVTLWQNFGYTQDLLSWERIPSDGDMQMWVKVGK